MQWLQYPKDMSNDDDCLLYLCLYLKIKKIKRQVFAESYNCADWGIDFMSCLSD